MPEGISFELCSDGELCWYTIRELTDGLFTHNTPKRRLRIDARNDLVAWLKEHLTSPEHAEV